MNTVDILIQYKRAFLAGLLTTGALAGIIIASGLLVGTLLGVLSSRYRRSVGFGARISSFVLSGIPVLVFLFWAHYPLQALLGVVIPPFVTAAAVLSIINMFAVADVVGAQLRDFPNEYTVAARVCGLSPATVTFRIQLPILLRQLIPVLLPVQVVMIQSTLFASLISVDEIFRVAQRVNSVEYKPIQIYSALALLFLAICLPLNGLAMWLRRRFTRDLSEQ